MSSIYQRIVNDIHGLDLDFRINDLDERLQVKRKGNWVTLDDTLQAIVEIDIAELGYGVKGKKKPPVTMFWNAATKLADTQRFNPIKDFFLSLEGKYNPITPVGAMSPQPYKIPAFAKAYFTNPDAQFGAFLFRFTVGCIAKVYEQERNPMLVLVSAQTKGKSYFVRWYCPLPDEYFAEEPLNPDDKDNRLLATTKFLQEVPELGATTRRADIEALKAFITKKVSADRQPYGKRPIHKPIVCSFIGSVNPDGVGFLNDPTGSTRFLCCEIDDIDHKYSQEVNKLDLWAEAYWFYKHGHKAWQLTDEEKQAQQRINSQFEITNALEQVIEDYIEFTGNHDDFMATTEIRDYLSVHYRYSNETMFFRELARLLYQRGLRPVREPFKQGQGHRRGYRGLKIRVDIASEPDKAEKF